MTTFLLRLCLVLLVTLGAARAEPYLAVDRGLTPFDLDRIAAEYL